MAITIDDKEFDKLGLSNNVVKRLKKAKPATDDDQADSAIVAALIKSIEKLINKPETQPQDLTPILNILTKTLESQKKVIDTLGLAKSARNWEFSLIRGENGFLQKIEAKESFRKNQ